MSDIPWDKTVELFTLEPGNRLDVIRREMTFREALDAFAAMPAGQQEASGIGMHAPYIRMLDGRPVAIGFLNAAALRSLIDTGSGFSTQRLPNRIEDFPPLA